MSFQSHRGLYDQWKPVPFVDDTDDRKDFINNYVKTAANNTNVLQDKYLEMYNRYNKEHHRVVGEDSEDASLEEDKKYARKFDKVNKKESDKLETIKPKEGGREDMTENAPESEEVKTKRGRRRNGRRHRKSREERRRDRKHKNSVKKDLSRKERRKKRNKRKNENMRGKGRRVEKDDLELNVEKFYSEHPKFRKNVDTITDGTNDDVESKIVDNEKEEVHDFADGKPNKEKDYLSESYDDDHLKEAYDVEDDADDANEQLKDSESDDKSSENFNDYYDYYDEDGDSSYSSSEQRAELEMLSQTPSDWYKHLDDHMQGDQPYTDDDDDDDDNASKNDDDNYDDGIYKTKEKDIKESTTVKDKKDYKQLQELDKYDLFQSKEVDSTDISSNKNSLTMEETDEEETVPTTDVEPSTSPNPPTSKTDSRPLATEATYPQWKERVETWNLIESSPVGK